MDNAIGLARSDGVPRSGFRLGRVALGGGHAFAPEDRHLEKHVAVLGGTGSGKSKFLELLMRHLHLAKRGFCLIDPHGDLSEDLLAFLARRRLDLGTDAILRVVHYLEPGYDVLFGYDPFQFQPSRPVPERLRENAYQAWLHTKVDRVSEIIQRKQGQTDFEGMPRLQRVLRDVLFAVGIAAGPDGRHLPLADALVLLDPEHPRCAAVHERVADRLPPEIRSDFERILGYRRAEDRLRETESTINRLRSLFSPILQAILGRSEGTIDFRAIVRGRHILLVNLRESDYFSADQANALGGLFIHQILSTAATTDRERRTPFYLLIDEAARFLGDDLQRALGECRKFKLSVVLAAQDLSSFRKKDLDMAPKVLSQCRSQVCFQQQHPDDLEVLARVLGYGNLDFTELEQVVDRHDGYDWVPVVKRSESTSTQRSHSRSQGESETHGESESRGESRTEQRSWQEGRTTGQTRGWSRTKGGSRSCTLGESVSRTQGSNSGETTHPGGDGAGSRKGSSSGRSSSATEGRSRSESEGHTWSHGESGSVSEGASSSRGGSEGTSVSSTQGRSRSVGHSVAETTGTSEGESRSESREEIPLARFREERHATGRLERPVEDQFQRIMQILHGLPTRYALVKLVDTPQAFPIEVDRVDEPFLSVEAKAHVIAAFKAKLHATHPYFFEPVFSVDERGRRIADHLGDANGDERTGDDDDTSIEASSGGSRFFG